MIQHIARGMFGAIIVDPKDPKAMPKADREYVLIQSELYPNPDSKEDMMANKWSNVMFTGGSRELMQQIAPSGPIYQAGTLSGHPVAMAAGLAMLELIQAPGFHPEIERRTTMLSDAQPDNTRVGKR